MSMNHTTLIDLARARLADADNAYCGGDSEHYSEATAAAAIAQAAAQTRLADNSDRIADALERIAAALEEDGDTEEPSGYEAALMASAMRRFAS